MKKPALLYSSAEIHACIKRLFGQPGPGDKRVALVAYIGSDAERYLPHPGGLRLICNPSAGGTDPDTLRQLMKRGAKVEISDSLHMKVYWSRNRGCVLTSANASSSALGRGGLKEVGIWLPSNAVNINRLIRYADPRIIRKSDLRRLDGQSREYKKKFGAKDKGKKSAPDFLKWYSAPHRSTWKISWTDKEVEGTARAVKEQTSAEYGHKDPKEWVSVGKYRVCNNDWVLSFTFTEQGIKSVKWIYVDFVVKINRKEKRYYDHAWPYHAVQVNPASKCPLPPFGITPQFRRALKSAILAYTPERLIKARTDIPPMRLVEMIADEIKSS